MLRNLAEFMTQQMNHCGYGRIEGCTFNQFNGEHSVSFHGGPDAILVENLILDIGELFRVLGCMDVQKVLNAAYKLSGEAKRWWISWSALLERN